MLKVLFLRYPLKTKRLLEIIIPGMSWLIITLPFWLSFWHPAVVAYFVIGFDVYWFYKSASLGLNALRSYLKLSSHVKVDWLSEAKKLPQADKIHHLIIIPEYKEPLKLLRETLDNLSRQDFFPQKQLSIVLATECLDPKASETGKILRKEFRHRFAHFWVTKHRLLTGEVAGKSSNMAYAGRLIAKKLEQLGYDLSLVTVTSCDADAQLHPKYFSYLTDQFLTDSRRDYHFYQAAIMFYNNIWRIPLPGRVANTVGSIFNLSVLNQPARLINFSTYSVSLKTVKKVGFWGVDVIPEDYHLFFKTYYQLGEKVATRPIFLPVLTDAAESKGFLKTMINQYEQHKRWAWGISDVPKVIRNFFLHSEIPLLDRSLRLLFLLEQHLLWPTNWFILTLGSTVPPLVNPVFKRTALGHNLPKISSFILTICIVFLILVIILDMKVKPRRPRGFAKWKIPVLYLQWLTLPIVGFFLSALPGLDAHTRLMLGKRLEYRRTEKIR